MSASDHVSSPQFFHGTVAKLRRGDIVRPGGGALGNGTNYTGESDSHFAYATSDPSSAWTYAENAWNASGSGHPRVYRVQPIGEHEEDPLFDESGRSRGNFEGDRRSARGWRVVNERSMPSDMGRPEDWA